MISAEAFRSAFIVRLALAFAVGTVGALPAHGTDGVAVPPGAARSPAMRVAIIGYRLATLGSSLCPRSAPVTGLLLHDLGSYDAQARSGIASRFALGEGIGVLEVVPGSLADQAGLKPGDEIIGLNEEPLQALGLPPLASSASYARIETFLDRLDVRLHAGPTSLTVRTSDQTRVATLARQEGCAGRVTVVPGSRPDAWSDDRYAAVTEGLVQVASDDELAFALGHEMAHVVMGHAGEPHGPLTGIGIGGKRSRDRERAADQLGISMSVLAGYDAAGADAFLERLARASSSSFSLTHPSVRSRIDAISQTAARIKSGPSASRR